MSCQCALGFRWERYRLDCYRMYLMIIASYSGVMFLVNYLNRNFTDALFPLFESIYSIEVLIQLLSIFFSFPVICAIWKTNVFHQNIRLQLISMPVNAIFAAIARIIIIAHQTFGPIQSTNSLYLIISSLFREYFKVYITGLALQLAFDRWIATTAWSWYESRAPTTVFVFIGQMIFTCSISLSTSYLLITERITDNGIILVYIVQITIGIVCLNCIQRHNQTEMVALKRGAKIETYSVSRTFQIRENLAILKMLSKVAALSAILTIPCFFLYAIYSGIPGNLGFDTFRYVSIALYDVWISISFLSIVVNFIRFERKFRDSFMTLPVIARIRNITGVVEIRERVVPVAVDEQNLHFSMLEKDWGSSYHSIVSFSSF